MQCIRSLLKQGWIISLVVLADSSLLGQTRNEIRNSSLSDQNLEFSEAKITLQTALAESNSLRQQLLLSQEQVGALSESLTLTNSLLAMQKAELSEYKSRIEVLGIETVGQDRSKLEQRLLNAVNDLRIADNARTQYEMQLVQLSEAALAYTRGSVSVDPDSRMALETALRAANKTLAGKPEVAQPETKNADSLSDASVISVKEELALVVANIGLRSGAKVGMPLQVWEGKKRIGTLRVIDVREKICGAVIQDLVSDQSKIKVGDRLQVDVSR